MKLDQDVLMLRNERFPDAVAYRAVIKGNFTPVIAIESQKQPGYCFYNVNTSGALIPQRVGKSLVRLSDVPYEPKIFNAAQLNHLNEQEQAGGITLDFLQYLSADTDRSTFVLDEEMFYDLYASATEFFKSYKYASIYVRNMREAIYRSGQYAISFMSVNNLVLNSSINMLDGFIIAFEVFDKYKPQMLTPQGVYYIVANVEDDVFNIDGLPHIPMHGYDIKHDIEYLRNSTVKDKDVPEVKVPKAPPKQEYSLFDDVAEADAAPANIGEEFWEPKFNPWDDKPLQVGRNVGGPPVKKKKVLSSRGRSSSKKPMGYTTTTTKRYKTHNGRVVTSSPPRPQPSRTPSRDDAKMVEKEWLQSISRNSAKPDKAVLFDELLDVVQDVQLDDEAVKAVYETIQKTGEQIKQEYVQKPVEATEREMMAKTVAGGSSGTGIRLAVDGDTSTTTASNHRDTVWHAFSYK